MCIRTFTIATDKQIEDANLCICKLLDKYSIEYATLNNYSIHASMPERNGLLSLNEAIDSQWLMIASLKIDFDTVDNGSTLISVRTVEFVTCFALILEIFLVVLFGVLSLDTDILIRFSIFLILASVYSFHYVPVVEVRKKIRSALIA